MDIRDCRLLKHTAAESLRSNDCNPKKLVLLHTGAVLLLSLLLATINHFLNEGIAGTGGLGGIGTRTVLATVQTCLQLAQLLILPFWQIGYVFVTMRFARRESTGPDDFLSGLQRFFPVLRLLLVEGLFYAVILFVATNIGSTLFLLTPWAQPFMDSVMAGLYSSDEAAIEAAIRTFAQYETPLLICTGIAFLPLAAPIFYRLRMAEFALLDNPGAGALAAMKASNRLLRGNTTALIKLDVSFWWFYVLDLLVSAVSYGDVLLPKLGITLPWSADVSFFITLGVYLLCQLALYVWRRNEVSTTYALFYDALRQPRPAPQPKPAPGNLPWNY